MSSHDPSDIADLDAPDLDEVGVDTPEAEAQAADELGAEAIDDVDAEPDEIADEAGEAAQALADLDEEAAEDAEEEPAASAINPDPEFQARIERMVEALLFAAAGPLSAKELRERLPDGADVGGALMGLKALYSGRGVELNCLAERWAFRTAADYAFLMTEERHEPRRLSKAALETLAIIAYHQPVTRAEIESVRGVSLSKGTLDLLLEMNYVRLRGRRRTPGRPVTYGTTDGFLEHFGMANLADLPGMSEMKAAGLLDMSLPAGFEVPQPGGMGADDEDPLGEGGEEGTEFHQDFLGEQEKP